MNNGPAWNVPAGRYCRWRTHAEHHDGGAGGTTDAVGPPAATFVDEVVGAARSHPGPGADVAVGVPRRRTLADGRAGLADGHRAALGEEPGGCARAGRPGVP